MSANKNALVMKLLLLICGYNFVCVNSAGANIIDLHKDRAIVFKSLRKLMTTNPIQLFVDDKLYATFPLSGLYDNQVDTLVGALNIFFSTYQKTNIGSELYLNEPYFQHLLDRYPLYFNLNGLQLAVATSKREIYPKDSAFDSCGTQAEDSICSQWFNSSGYDLIYGPLTTLGLVWEHRDRQKQINEERPVTQTAPIQTIPPSSSSGSACYPPDKLNDMCKESTAHRLLQYQGCLKIRQKYSDIKYQDFVNQKEDELLSRHTELNGLLTEHRLHRNELPGCFNPPTLEYLNTLSVMKNCLDLNKRLLCP